MRPIQTATIATFGLATVIATAVACSSYGDGDTPADPDGGGSSASTEAGATGTSSSSGDAHSSDAGADAAAPTPFCKRDENFGTAKCIDFDGNRASPYGFDQMFPFGSSFKLGPSPVSGDDQGLVVTTSFSPAYGVFFDLPSQTSVTIAFDVALSSIGKDQLITGILSSGDDSCPAQALGIVANPVTGGFALSSTIDGQNLGTMRFDVPVHVELESSPPPAPGKALTIKLKVVDAANKESGAAASTLIKGACTSVTTIIGIYGNGNGAPMTTASSATFDNIVVR